MQRGMPGAVLCRGRYLQSAFRNGHDDIIGLGNAKKKTTFGNRLHIDTIPGNHHGVTATEIHPIIGGGRGIDEPEPHFFPWFEIRVFGQCFPIGQKCGVVDIRNIRSFHTISPKFELCT